MARRMPPSGFSSLTQPAGIEPRYRSRNVLVLKERSTMERKISLAVHSAGSSIPGVRLATGIARKLRARASHVTSPCPAE